MKTVLVLAGLLVAAVIGIHTLLQNGTVVRYLDDHPDSQIVPGVEYAIGTGYYLFQDLPQAATYFIRIPQRYPKSDYADDAYFNYLQSVDDMMTLPHSELADAYDKYLERFPEGKHKTIAEHRIDHYRNNR
jgi:outer membrane protein assembly factor BamD (BamD/ComL family)